MVDINPYQTPTNIELPVATDNIFVKFINKKDGYFFFMFILGITYIIHAAIMFYKSLSYPIDSISFEFSIIKGLFDLCVGSLSIISSIFLGKKYE